MLPQYTILPKEAVPLKSYHLEATRIQPTPLRLEVLSKQSKNDKLSKLTQSITCKICLKEGCNPHMCPKCQQMYCQLCIKQWLNQCQACPNCQNSLRHNQLVSCSRLYNQITSAIQTVKEVDICKKHNMEISYYCKTCDIPVCADCAVMDQQRSHTSHVLDKISHIASKKQQAIKSQLSELSNKKKVVRRSLEEIDQQMEAVKDLRNQKHLELQHFKKNEAVDRRHSDIAAKNQRVEGGLQQKLKSLKVVYDSVTSKLNNYSKSKFLFEEENILRQVNQSVLLREQCTEEDEEEAEGTIVSQLVPSFDSKTFFIRDYSDLRKRREIVFTDVFRSRGLEWRLKIYPHGSQTSQDPQNIPHKDTHISIFVELVRGLQEGSRYKYKIQIINQKNREKKLTREFESEFDSGEIWGYNTYSKISTLYEEYFVHPQDDYLEVVLYIRSPSFYTQVLDQQKLIENKNLIIQQNKKKIKDLKDKLKRVAGSSKDGSNSFISLDDICEIGGNQLTPPDSPQIDDQQIYAPVIKPKGC